MDAAANMAEYFVSEDQNNQNHYIIACGGSAIGNEMHRLRTIGILNKLQEAYGLSYEKSVEELKKLKQAVTLRLLWFRGIQKITWMKSWLIR